jgi:hypothetical protein
MSDLYQAISEGERKAPAGQLRLVMSRKPVYAPNTVEHYLVRDYDDRDLAFRTWRELNNPTARPHDAEFTLYDDQARVVDGLGTHITEAERIAPDGKFRLVATDCNPNSDEAAIWLVHDFDDKDKAIEAAYLSHEPWIGFQVYDDTGATLIPA